MAFFALFFLRTCAVAACVAADVAAHVAASPLFHFGSFVVPKQGKQLAPFARILSLLLAAYANL
jgi:hypothetical protein